MTFKTKNDYIIGKAYKLKSENNVVVVNNDKTDCLIKVVAADTYYESYEQGDILLVDRNHTETYTVAGEKYIAVESGYVIAQLQGVT